MAGLGDTQGEREKTLKEQENRTEKVHVQLPVAASATECLGKLAASPCSRFYLSRGIEITLHSFGVPLSCMHSAEFKMVGVK